MAHRRRTLSSLCCSSPSPKNPNSSRIKFVNSFACPLRFPPLCLVVCRSGGFSSSLKISGSLVRRAPPLSERISSYFVADDFLIFSPCRVNRITRVMLVVVVSSTSRPAASVNRRRLVLHDSLRLGQSPFLQFRKKGLTWAWPIFGPCGFCCGPLSFLGCKLAVLACPNVGQHTFSAPTTTSSSLRLPVCHLLAIPCFFTHRFTGYFSGFPLPLPDTSLTGPTCLRSRTTFVGLDPALFRRSLLTGYFSGVSMPACKAAPGCSQPRTTIVNWFEFQRRVSLVLCHL